jgi:hypothetical protein
MKGSNGEIEIRWWSVKVDERHRLVIEYCAFIDQVWFVKDRDRLITKFGELISPGVLQGEKRRGCRR